MEEQKEKRIRKTSIDAYRALVENGGLSEARRKVYDYLYRNGVSTQKKVAVYFGGDTLNTIRPRFAELEKMGLIEACGVVDCEETGVKNMLWDVTDRIEPRTIDKSKTNKQKRQELLDMLEELNSKTSDMFIKQDLQEIINYVNENFK